MPDWSVQPLRQEDIDEFVQCQFVSFVGNTLHEIVFPTPEAAREAHHKAMTDHSKLHSGDEIYYFKAVDDAAGKIVGGIKFSVYGSKEVLHESPHAAGLPTSSEKDTEDDEYAHYILNSFLGRRIRDIKGHHALIDLLFVHPDHHRRGVGRALVGRTCSIADERGLNAIVEASPQGKRTYEICGYESKESVEIPPGRWEQAGKPVQQYYWMERKIPSRN